MILLLGGTSESLEVADYLTASNQEFILSVTTEYGEQLAKQHAKLVSNQVLVPDTFAAFFTHHQINLIIDATHPFARVISTTIIEAAKQAAIPYIRFERKDTLVDSPNLKLVKSEAEACAYLKNTEGRVYLSTGSKTAPYYAEQLGIDRVWVRVLPTATVLTMLEASGYTADNIDAVKGPFTVDLNVELFKRAQAQYMITKQSGRRGGFQEKLAACQQLGIQCVVITRPAIDYPNKVTSLDELEDII